MRNRALLFVLVALMLLPLHTAAAQTLDFSASREQVADLKGSWHFHVGDPQDGSMSWASPDFEDASWQLLPFDHSWDVPGYRESGGDCWYRVKLRVPSDHPPLALLIPAIFSSYQVFANGRMVGQVGGLPPRPQVLFRNQDNLLVPIPSILIPKSGEITLAFRIWHWPLWNTYPGAEDITIRLGDAQLLARARDLVFHDTFWSDAAHILVCFCDMLAALAGFLVFVLRPKEREYLWFGLYYLACGIQTGNSLSKSYVGMPFVASTTLDWFLSFSTGLLFLLFLNSILKARRGWLFWITIASLICFLATGILLFITPVNPLLADILQELTLLPSRVTFIAMVAVSARRGNLDGRLLLGPVIFIIGVFSLGDIIGMFYDMGNVELFNAFHWYAEIIRWPFNISFPDLAQFLTQLAVLAILILRFARSRRDEERLKGEFEAARAVQQVLVPEAIVETPGFQIETVYHPFSQVGGDFFQILPLISSELPGDEHHPCARGVLIAIGDVSGKGMPAAMTVSLLVGTFRTLVHYTQRPGEILAAMNRRMLGRSNGGFTTCLVLRIDQDGQIAAANAGHIAPYVGGREMSVEGSLPLGLTANASYAETISKLAPGTQLTLMTDGVVEAQSSSGELFGFDRTAAISTYPAEDIARAAEAYGQEDDITVLTLRSAPVEMLIT